MQKTPIAVHAFLARLSRVHAAPGFARQTGLSCNVYQRNPPELTPFGRRFMLMDYGLGSLASGEKADDTKNWLLSQCAPLTVMAPLRAKHKSMVSIAGAFTSRKINPINFDKKGPRFATAATET
jgi:hypothetical protein